MTAKIRLYNAGNLVIETKSGKIAKGSFLDVEKNLAIKLLKGYKDLIKASDVKRSSDSVQVRNLEKQVESLTAENKSLKEGLEKQAESENKSS